ncbi:glutathione synthase [Hahella ganghwensis]|uniref:glutathione synthase n=1 Tax=Hahella ganghwensis TaxID=286420 RepID=UPI00037456B2|nr:glutathione synthase [Hahella ganghwensis]
MSIKIGVVMDPISSINVKKDSTLAMLLAAQRKGWQIFYMEQGDLYLDQGLPYARMRSLKVADDPQNWFEMTGEFTEALDSLDIILMRKDPPVDSEFIFATHIMEAAERRGTLVVNKTQSLRDCNEKLFATQFADLCPPVLVSRDNDRLRRFFAEQQDVIYKPLDGMGGRSIFRVKSGDSNLGVILETLTDNGRRQIMAQRYLPEIKDGDKRILLIDGEPVPYALARIPSQGENRGNLAAGGRGEGRPLTERDREICERVAPVLKEKGLYFVGLDVIGDYLTEINVTSPTCIRELDKQFGLDIAGQLMDFLEKKAGK